MGYVDYGFYGTSGTLSGVTASTTSGSNTITVNTAAGLAAGNYIAIAGVPYQFIINSISGTTVNVSPAPTATVTNAAVSYVAIDNPAMAYGYNVGHINPSEPEWAKRHEADYLDVDGYRKCETYDEFKPVGSPAPVFGPTLRKLTVTSATSNLSNSSEDATASFSMAPMDIPPLRSTRARYSIGAERPTLLSERAVFCPAPTRRICAMQQSSEVRLLIPQSYQMPETCSISV